MEAVHLLTHFAAQRLYLLIINTGILTILCNMPIRYTSILLLGSILFLLIFAGCGTSAKSHSGKTSSPILNKYSNLLHAKVSNEKLYRFIDQWIGVPHKMGGNDKGGIDCSHWVYQCQNQVFSVKPFYNASDLSKKIKPVSKENLQEGDLVFFSFKASHIDHVGIYLINHYFVHASTSKGVMISSLDEAIFIKNYRTGGKWI